MHVPGQELPDVTLIAKLARDTLPQHYRLRDVRCDYGSPWHAMIPTDFEVVIEYEDCLDQASQGSLTALAAHDKWARPLEEMIRAKWPAPTIRISFVARASAAESG